MVSGCQRSEREEGRQLNLPVGCFKCNKCRVSCPILVETNRFKSTNTQKTYQIKQRMTCESSYVLYLATCKKCKGQYVGKSQTAFKTRHSNQKLMWVYAPQISKQDSQTTTPLLNMQVKVAQHP